MNTSQTTADGLKILYQRYYANNPERQLELEKARIDDEVARKIFKIKETYHLSTKALAELIHTDESVIEALENADYEGNSFLLLNLIATALKMKVEFELVFQVFWLFGTWYSSIWGHKSTKSLSGKRFN